MATRWTPEVMIGCRRVGGTAISADGRLVAYTISVPAIEGEKSEYVTHVWLASTDGKRNEQITAGEKSCTEPAFSPDGKRLAFISSQGTGAKNQIWVLDLPAGEPEQVTNARNNITAFRWSPDSRSIAYIMTDPETDEEEKEKKEKRDARVVDLHVKCAHLYATEIDNDKQGGRTIRRLTAGSFHVVSFDWAPDGTTIVFQHQINPTVEALATSDISLVQAGGGTVTPIVTWKGCDTTPLYSPDGTLVAFASDGEDPRWPRLMDIYVIPPVGGKPRKLAETPDRRAVLLGWSADGNALFISEVDRTSARIFELPVDGRPPRVFTMGPGTWSSPAISKDGSMMAFVHQTSELAPEVFVSGLQGFEPRQISNAGKDNPKFPMGNTEVITWKSSDEKKIDGLLTYPVMYEKGVRYPLIVQLHGGPASAFLEEYTAAASVYPTQAFAQEGYAILCPNPRGSTGYGRDFQESIFNDWGQGDYEDVIAGVDKVIEMGIARADGLIVCGWSYGGYLTSMIISKTQRFKAASVGAGITNLVSFTGTTDIPSYLPDYFGGDFWDRPEAYAGHSPIFRVRNISTPTQILHGELDERVPLPQGRELYSALKRRGVPTEMIIYPRTPHAPQEPKLIVDLGNRMITWFNKHLGPRPGDLPVEKRK